MAIREGPNPVWQVSLLEQPYLGTDIYREKNVMWKHTQRENKLYLFIHKLYTRYETAAASGSQKRQGRGNFTGFRGTIAS